MKTKNKTKPLPKPKPILCAHNFEDVPTTQMLGLRQCVKCGKQEVK